MPLPVVIQDLYDDEKDLPVGPELTPQERDEPRTKVDTEAPHSFFDP